MNLKVNMSESSLFRNASAVQQVTANPQRKVREDGAICVCMLKKGVWDNLFHLQNPLKSFLLAVLLTGWQVKNGKEVFMWICNMWELQQCVLMQVCEEICKETETDRLIFIWENLTLHYLHMCCMCAGECALPVFGEDPETPSEHFILAVSHG